MEKMVELLLNAENVRMVLMVMLGYCGYVKLNASFDKKLGALDKKIDGVEVRMLKAMDEKISAFHTQLKANDFAHLNATIEALTFTLEKNNFLKREDKEYIDGRLDR